MVPCWYCLFFLVLFIYTLLLVFKVLIMLYGFAFSFSICYGYFASMCCPILFFWPCNSPQRLYCLKCNLAWLLFSSWCLGWNWGESGLLRNRLVSVTWTQPSSCSWSLCNPNDTPKTHNQFCCIFLYFNFSISISDSIYNKIPNSNYYLCIHFLCPSLSFLAHISIYI